MQAVKNLVSEILSNDKNLVLRPSYGETSLSNYKDEYESMMAKIEFIGRYSHLVDDRTNNDITGHLNHIKGQFAALVGYDATAYVANKGSILTQVRAQYNEVKRFWPPYACAALEESGLLTNVNLQNEFKDIAVRLKNKTDEALKKIGDESAEIIKQATAKAKEIEGSVRKTAQKISVKEAQDQFDEAAKHNINQIIVWGILSGVLAVSLIGYLIYLFNIELSKDWSWQILYHSVVRVALLSLISSLLAFGLKVLKSHLHLHQHNLHRKRVANSISSFVESANSNEQRDIILAQLVNAVSAFGTTGLVNGDDDSGKIVVDNINRTIETVRGVKE